MDDSTPHEPRADAFPLARKGYDRRKVDEYREATGERIDALERHIESLEVNMSELGLARPTDLAAELDVVGEEVKRVLQEARVAAEQMRSRAADDAARWRAEADEESRALREVSRSDAYEIRRNVWETGSEMLASAVGTANGVAIAATERALFTQAEAEREASRLIGDAKRDRDEAVGGAREEAERLVATARQESESIMSSARRQADTAQERARALEVRRAELMIELDTARATIAGNDVASNPVVVPDEVVPMTTETVAIADENDDVRSHWPEDEGSVKIVSAARVMSTEPVDADAMVAEIEAMRNTESSSLLDASPQPEPDPVPSAEGLGDSEERSDEAGRSDIDQSDSEPESSASPSGGVGIDEAADGGDQDLEPEPDSASVLSAAGPENAEEPGDEAGGTGSDEIPAISDHSDPETEPEPEPEPDPEPDPMPDPLSGLFAQLRDPAEGGSSDQPDPEPEPVPSAEGRADAEERSDDAGGMESDELPAAGDQSEPRAEPSLDPFALRERHLLRVQNRALRSVKRGLVEAQNKALEDLRLVDGWEPDEDIVAEEVSEALSLVARESMVAGFAAAAEMMETTETPQPDNVDPGDPSTEFAGALIEAAQSAVARSRGAGAGHREIASGLSRVFRSWRTDEAERRVQFASRSAYHIGVTAALADLGATDLEVIPSGRPCRECPANKGPWSIADGLPSGTVMPPSRIECACAIVPSR